jgi:hypothetical protein
LLTKTTKGRPGGQLTLRAHKLLREKAWEDATPEEKRAAHNRTIRAQRLSERYETGEIDIETYIRLAEEMVGKD